MSPQDLVRIGRATEEQFDGKKFKSSPNFAELPQIVVINKTIEVVPFWGEEEVCQVGITRTDFDITAEAGITISPVAVFLGSIISQTTDAAIKKSCKSKKITGNLCKMITGPGEIIAISQTIQNDSNGLPILKKAALPNGGKLIDADGAWMFDLPMNFDYVTTNEFGEQVISKDEKVGVPTKAKYRFKIKWQQSKNISEDYRRAYFLVPNLREMGWSTSTIDPAYTSNLVEKSYAFDLDWSGYTNPPYNVTNQDLLSYINCEDRFYEFDYNKVYTVAGLIDNYKVQRARENFLGIKRIDDNTCEDTTNKFPTNEGVFHNSINFDINIMLITIIGTILRPFLLLYEISAAITLIVKIILIYTICPLIKFVNKIANAIRRFFGGKPLPDPPICDVSEVLRSIKLPMITFPDCEFCSCSDADTGNSESSPTNYSNTYDGFIYQFNNTENWSVLLNDNDFYTYFNSNYWNTADDADTVITLLAGRQDNDESKYTTGTLNTVNASITCNELPFGERVNLFNTKNQYYLGRNQISVTYEPDTNTSSHFDNTLTFICNAGNTILSAGTMFTLTDPANSKDPNITGNTLNSFGTNNTLGVTNYLANVTIDYANPTSPTSGNLSVTYATPILSASTTDQLYLYPSDVEYYQVISAMTISQFRNMIPFGTKYPESFGDIIESSMEFIKSSPSHTQPFKPIEVIDPNAIVVIAQRGVDPYSPKIPTQIDLSRICGHSTTDPNLVVKTDLRLNVPIKNTVSLTSSEIMFNHNPGSPLTNASTNNGFDLYFNSYIFSPDSSYLSYVTNAHTYYSSLDYDLIYNKLFSINSSNTATILDSNTPLPVTNPKTWLGSVGQKFVSSSSNSFYYSAVTGTARYYGPDESIVGGSFMWGLTVAPYSNYYFSPVYSSGNTLTMNNNNRIVMRSDRLPSSDFAETNLNNTYVFQQNQQFTAYLFQDGTNTIYKTSQYNQSLSDNDKSPNNSIEQNVLTTFDCGNMHSLKCYDKVNGQITLIPNCPDDDAIYKIDNKSTGCYVFCKDCDFQAGDKSALTSAPGKIFKNLGNDIVHFEEYIFRLKFFYALCQGVLSEVFVNNWVNGTLFAYPFKINHYFNSKNQVSDRSYCRDLVYLHNPSNTFYYRSSPWVGTINNGNYVGSETSGYGQPGENGSNFSNLKYPTTIMNLGPRDVFLHEISLNGNYDGYVMDKFSQTTYNDTSDITNLFAFTRIIDVSFLQQLFGARQSERSILQLFSRGGKRVDADFAQSVAINSQFGVVPFDAEFYNTSVVPPNTGSAQIVVADYTKDVYFNGNLVTSKPFAMMGIFFDSGSEGVQIRDYISPVRTIRYNPTIQIFGYDYIPVKSQKTPNYRWTFTNPNQDNYNSTTIFGTQRNNWVTSSAAVTASSNKKYQELDRFDSSLYSYQNVPLSNQYSARGYIYSDDSTQFPIRNLNPYVVANPQDQIVGAPWYFYFGLVKGSSAINKFRDKYIGETTLNE
jgi:hypothetical protein